MMKTIKPKLDLVVDADNYMSETPVWVGRERALYWVNCEDPPELHRWDPAKHNHRVWPMPARIGGFVPRENGKLIVALANGIYDFDPAAGELRLRVQSSLPSYVALHESGCDRQGRMWIGGFDLRVMQGAMDSKDASLYRLEDDKLIPMASGISCSNGFAVSPDGRTLYHSDSTTGVVKSWDLDTATGNISNAREFCRVPFEEGSVDGATVDSEGGYWAAMVFAGKLRRYLPDGTLDLEVQLPFTNPTSLTFGGPDLDTLYITTTKLSYGPPKPGSEGNGGLYSFKPGVAGLPVALAL